MASRKAAALALVAEIRDRLLAGELVAADGMLWNLMDALAVMEAREDWEQACVALFNTEPGGEQDCLKHWRQTLRNAVHDYACTLAPGIARECVKETNINPHKDAVEEGTP